MNRYGKLPPIGARIMKSSVSVALCMLIYHLRTLLPVGNGIPFYSALAALWCLQPYHDTAKKNAGQRSIGTLTGALFGLMFLMILRASDITDTLIVYLLASVVIIPVIYATIVLDKRNAAFFSCVVFLSIALTHSFDDDPYLFVFNRVLDTFIGIGVGLLVNSFRLPVKHDSKTLYVSGIDHVLISDDDPADQYSKVELNRLIESGVKFTVSTVHTPAEVISIMNGVELEYPVIVMDGAAMYDIKEKEYIETKCLPSEICGKAEKIIGESGLHCFVNALYDQTLIIFYGELKSPAEKGLFETHRSSPYRNYVSIKYRHYDNSEQVIYLTVLAQKDKVLRLEKDLAEQLGESIRVTLYPSVYDGYMYLKVYSPSASKQEMLKKLQQHTDAESIVTIGSIKGEYDVYIGDGGGNATIKKLKKLYRHS